MEGGGSRAREERFGLSARFSLVSLGECVGRNASLEQEWVQNRVV